MTAPAAQVFPVLAPFVRPDGAITVGKLGDFVDPYFANRALLIAWEARLDAALVTERWLAWLLLRQRADGGFDRFCQAGEGWRACKPADADDSSLATFLQLATVYEQHRSARGLVATSPALAAAKQRARQLLRTLRQPNGIYRAFADRPVEYLMDNTEVYASLVAIGEKANAAALRRALAPAFLRDGGWQPANETFKERTFYPHALAPAYRWLTDMVTPGQRQAEFDSWAEQWGAAWLERTQDAYAWGLIAWGARDVHDQHWVRCWRHLHQDPKRNKGWTVLDEAVDQSLAHLGVQQVALSCSTIGIKTP